MNPTRRWLVEMLPVLTLALWSAIAFSLAGCTNPHALDSAKYAAMRPEARAELDRAFFNEFEVVDQGSNRYGPGVGSIEKRQAEFERWANDGYLPAWVAVRLRANRDDTDAIKVLIKAADASDISAMCMGQLLLRKYGVPRDGLSQPAFMAKLVTWKDKGVAAGHGQCNVNKALQFFRLDAVDVVKSTFDYPGAMPYLLEASKQGYYRAHLLLFQRDSLYKTPDYNNVNEVSRALCWGRLAVQHANNSSFVMYLHNLKFDAYGGPNSNKAYSTGIYKKYDIENYPIDRKVVEPKDCLALESPER